LLHLFCRFLKLFTDLPLEQIAAYETLSGAELNAVKVVLADEATRLLHGEACLAGIHHTVQALFAAQSASAATSDLESLEQVALSAIDLTSTGNPAVRMVSVVDLLVKSGFAASKNAARRLIAQGGAKVNDLKVDDEAAVVIEKDFDANGRLKLSGSKKKHVVVVLP
jgi:tyrosyl-tRNA synthetase